MRYVLVLLPLLAVGLAFQYVSRQIASGESGAPFPAAPVTLKPIDPNALMGPPVALDSRETARINGENIANQARLFNQHMEDVRNYARDPAGWHGKPPF